MRILAIHSNNLFFSPDDIEENEVPNFYEWLAVERGVSQAFSELDKEYQAEKNKRPLHFTIVYDLVMKCLTREELLAYCDKYNEFFFNYGTETKLKELRNLMDVIILTSYPKELYNHVHEKGLADVFGAEPILNQNNFITGLKGISLREPELVREEMEKIGFGNNFTLEPNRYGLLELLIDRMIRDKVEKIDIILLGKGVNAEPLKKVCQKFVDNLDELL